MRTIDHDDEEDLSNKKADIEIDLEEEEDNDMF